MGEGARSESEAREEVPAETMITTCRRCGREKPPLAHQHGDAFCSTECAKVAHGVQDQWIGDPRRVKHSPHRGSNERTAPGTRSESRSGSMGEGEEG